MKTLALAAAAAFAFYHYPHLRPAVFGGPLDGSAWDVRVRANSLFSFSKRDTLVFQKGRLTSLRHLPEGYGPARYGVPGPQGELESILSRISGRNSVAGTPMEFQSSLSHDEQGTLHWQGRVQGDFIQGTMTWLRKDGRVKEFTFRGSRRSA